MADNLLPPHNADIEEAFCGAAMTNGDVAQRWQEVLEPAEFYVTKVGWVWDAIRALSQRREAVDLLTVAQVLQARGQLDEAGGEAYLAQISMAAPSYMDENADSYARLIKAYAMRRRLLRAMSEAARIVFDASVEIDQVIGRVTGLIGQATIGTLKGAPVAMVTVVQERVHRLEQIASGEVMAAGLSTGLKNLDTLTYGLFPGDSVLIAARPRVGKSGLLACIADNVSRNAKLRVVIFSLEMPKETWADRLIAAVARVDFQKVRLGGLNGDEWERVYKAAAWLDTRCWIDDTAGQTDAEIRTKARQLHAEHGLDLVVVDYVQMVRSAVKGGSRYQEIGFVSRSMKEMAKELKVPVVCAAMVGRGVEQRDDKRPELSDLRESGDLEADADQVWMIYREELYDTQTMNKGVAEIHVAKNRNGPVGHVDVGYDPVRQTFYNIVKEVIQL